MIPFSFGNFRTAPDVDIEPQRKPAHWRAFMLSGGLHIATATVPQQDAEGVASTVRLTTPIKAWSATRRILVTKSGRTYHLEDEPTSDPVALAFIASRMALEGRDSVDLSDALWSAFLSDAS
ncbi:MAG TPA: hypothetical protein VEZ89_03035 [Rubrivivax sp.]|nr:hypothetical protein [Rubrivivax sp.]